MDSSELNKILSELRKLNKKSEERKTTESSSSSDLSFLTDISKGSLSKSDKDLTLAEYMQKYNKVDEVITNEKKTRKPDSTYEGLLKNLEGKSSKYIERKIDEDFEYREVTTLFSKHANGMEEIKTKDIFANKSKERCNNVTVRIKPYSNTKSTMTVEKKMSPLKLEQYSSD